MKFYHMKGLYYSSFGLFEKIEVFKNDLMKNGYRKYFQNWRYDAADRTFYGTIQWREDMFYDYEYEMVFDSTFTKIQSGKAIVYDNKKQILNKVYFGDSSSKNGINYKGKKKQI